MLRVLGIALVSALISLGVAACVSENTATPECRDGQDNDGNGRVDFPLDLGCGDYDDLHEAQVTLPADFDPARVRVETQAWILPKDKPLGNREQGASRGFGHLHNTVDLPFARAVSGVLNLNVRLTAFHNPSEIQALQWELRYPTGQLQGLASVDKSCAFNPTQDLRFVPHVCAYNVPVLIDTTQAPVNGWVNLSIRTIQITPGNLRWTAGTIIPLYLNNGGNRQVVSNAACTGACVIGNSWFEGEDAHGLIVDNLPTLPIPSNQTHTVRYQAYHDGGEMSQRIVGVRDGLGHEIPKIDNVFNTFQNLLWPFEPIKAVTALKTVSNPSTTWHEVTIDPTASQLSLGWHVLMLRSIGVHEFNVPCNYCTAEEPVTHHVHNVMPFYVGPPTEP